MKGYSVYRTIQQLKARGFRKDAVAKNLGINWRTVDRYWSIEARTNAIPCLHQAAFRICGADMVLPTAFHLR